MQTGIVMLFPNKPWLFLKIRIFYLPENPFSSDWENIFCAWEWLKNQQQGIKQNSDTLEK